MSEENFEQTESGASMMNLEDEVVDLDIDLSIVDQEPVEQKVVSVKTLFDNNFHFGSKTKNRNKSMSEYVFTSKKDIDMIDLNKSAFLFENALQALRKCVARGGKVLFVGTESHSISSVKAHSERCAQYYVSNRWLGGLLTNWDKTFYPWVLSMKKLEKQIEDGYVTNFKKQEQVMLLKKRDRFLKFYEGVKDMRSLPNMLVVTSYREKNAIAEAERLNIPVVMLADTTANPSNIRYLVPGNDCSIKAVDLFCNYCANACLEGLKDELGRIEKRKEKEKEKEATRPQKREETRGESRQDGPRRPRPMRHGHSGRSQ